MFSKDLNRSHRQLSPINLNKSLNVVIDENIVKYIKPFQLDGIKFLYKNYEEEKSCILNDESGLGKCFQVVCFLSAIFRKQYNDNYYLIICKQQDRLKHWLYHLEVFTQLTGRIISSESTIDHPNNVLSSEHINLIDYTNFSRYFNQLALKRFQYLVIDECGIDKNSYYTSSQLDQLVKLQSVCKLVVATKDITLNLNHFYQLLRLCNRDEIHGYSFDDFKQRFKLIDFEQRFYKRNDILNFCIKLRKRRHKSDLPKYELPLILPEVFQENFIEWEAETFGNKIDQSVNQPSTSNNSIQSNLLKNIIDQSNMYKLSNQIRSNEQINDDDQSLLSPPQPPPSSVIMSPLLLESQDSFSNNDENISMKLNNAIIINSDSELDLFDNNNDDNKSVINNNLLFEALTNLNEIKRDLKQQTQNVRVTPKKLNKFQRKRSFSLPSTIQDDNFNNFNLTINKYNTEEVQLKNSIDLFDAGDNRYSYYNEFGKTIDESNICKSYNNIEKMFNKDDIGNTTKLSQFSPTHIDLNLIAEYQSINFHLNNLQKKRKISLSLGNKRKKSSSSMTSSSLNDVQFITPTDNVIISISSTSEDANDNKISNNGRNITDQVSSNDPQLLNNILSLSADPFDVNNDNNRTTDMFEITRNNVFSNILKIKSNDDIHEITPTIRKNNNNILVTTNTSSCFDGLTIVQRNTTPSPPLEQQQHSPLLLRQSLSLVSSPSPEIIDLTIMEETQEKRQLTENYRIDDDDSIDCIPNTPEYRFSTPPKQSNKGNSDVIPRTSTSKNRYRNRWISKKQKDVDNHLSKNRNNRNNLIGSPISHSSHKRRRLIFKKFPTNNPITS